MKTNLLLILFTLVVLASCKKVSVKPDPENPDLPGYSEQGLNAGGILINNDPWLTVKPGGFLSLSTIRPLQLHSFPTGDSIVLLLNGSYKDNSLQNKDPKTIFVVIKNLKIVTDNDLLQLSGRSYSLDGNINYGGFSDYYGYNKSGNAIGSISFGKVSEISNISFGNGSPGNPILHPYIVAGHLDMKLLTATNYVLEKGRFDLTIIRSSNQFWVF